MLGHLLDSHVLLKIVGMQMVAVGIVLFVLKRLLDRELMRAALEHMARFCVDINGEDIVIVTAFRLSVGQEARFKDLLQGKIPSEKLMFYTDASMVGGVLVKWGPQVLDYGLLTKIRQMFKGSL